MNLLLHGLDAPQIDPGNSLRFKRKVSDQAWKVPVKELLDANCNLDRKNPNAKVDFEHLPPDQLADDILKKELRIAELMREIKASLGAKA
jgi:type I restriction enzyme M protein